MTAHLKDATRARQAAGFVASRFRAARHQAIAQERSVAVVFDLIPTGWSFRVCADENGNGIRRADIASGVDPCLEGPFDFAALFPGIAVAADPLVPDPDGVVGSSDPVRFGVSNIASFSPLGSCTAGSLYLTSAQGQLYAIRVGGVTGRTRVLKYHPTQRAWKDA